MQSRVSSIIESCCNTASGFLIAWAMTIFVFPFFGIMLTVGKGFIITTVMTVVSVIRSYVWRRYFNRLIRRDLKSTY